MTGPEHYREAENLIKRSNEQDPEFAGVLLAQAQVHAALALVAATVQTQPDEYSEHLLTPRLVKGHPTDARQHQYEPSAWAEAVL